MMLHQQLTDGTIAPGAALPSEPDLARSTNLSRTTVRRALARLAEEGMIERRHGSGTYATVQGAAIPTVLLFEKIGLIPSIGDQEITAIAADHIFSRELSVNIGAPLLAIRRSVRDRHGTLLEYHEAFYDPELYTVQMQVHRERVGKRGMRWRPTR